jgi:hypothetical protein
MQRMAMRMGGLSINNAGTSAAAAGLPPVRPSTSISMGTAVPRPGRAAAAAASKKASKMVSMDDSDEEEEEDYDEDSGSEFDISDADSEVNSPTPMPKARAAAAAAERGPSNLGGKRKPAVPGEAKKKTAAACAPKALDDGGLASPAVNPSQKVQRIRPSPFHKGSGKPAGKSAAGPSRLGQASKTAAAKPPAKKKTAALSDEEDEEAFEVIDTSVAAAKPRAVVPRRAAPKVTYAER